MKYADNLIYNSRLIFFLFFLVLTILSPSCTKDGMDDSFGAGSGSENSINISTTSTSDTKASITTETLEEIHVFTFTSSSTVSSWAEYDAEPKMFNALYSKDAADGIFKPSNVDDEWDYMWGDDLHHFYAYAPEAAEQVSLVDADDSSKEAISNTDGSATSYSFPALKYSETNDDPSKHSDLVYTAEPQVNIYRKFDWPVVYMKLEHALSKIAIDIKNSYDIDDPDNDEDDRPIEGNMNAEFTLDGIRIGNVAQTAVLRYKNHDTPSFWSEYGDYDSYDLQRSISGIARDAEKTEVYGETKDDYLYLLPQDLYANSSYIRIDYTFDKDGPDLTAYEPQKRFKIIPLPEGAIWKAGEAYRYVLEVDPLTDYVTVTAMQVDWGATRDVISQITYTFLYLEKSNYTINYAQDDNGVAKETAILDINFATNASDEDDNLKILYGTPKLDDGGEPMHTSEGYPILLYDYVHPITGAETTVELFDKDKDNDRIVIIDQVVEVNETSTTTRPVHIKCRFELDLIEHQIKCEFLPNTYYRSQEIKLTADIISTELKINFSPVRVTDYTSIAEINRELGTNLSELLTSNCYIINSAEDAIMEYYIPISRQINKFYGDGTYYLKDLNNWNVEVYAYDNEFTINRLDFSKHLTGISADSPVEEPCFKVAIPQNYTNYGNIIVQVSEASSNKILWTWHLWFTDYNPNKIRLDGTQVKNSSGANIYKNIGEDKVHRYAYGTIVDFSYHLDRNVGAYAASYEGHGGLGGRGWLVYQFGRLAPIMGFQARKANGTTYMTWKHDTDTQGKVSLDEAIQNPNIIYHNNSTGIWLEGFDRLNKVWNDPELLAAASTDKSEYQKSLFDPSPLGWMIPPMGEYHLAIGWKSTYTQSTNIQTYTSSSQNVYFSTTNIDPITGEAGSVIPTTSHIWSSTDASYGTQGLAQSMLFENYQSANTSTNISRGAQTLGAPIRPIFQFEEE